jgi:hypothetical protein
MLFCETQPAAVSFHGALCSLNSDTSLDICANIPWAYRFDSFITDNLISWTKEDYTIPHIGGKSFSSRLQLDKISLVPIYLFTLQSFKHTFSSLRL